MSLHIMQPFVDKEGQNVLKLQKHSFSRGFDVYQFLQVEFV